MQNDHTTSENPLRLLIVDDDPDDLELCVRELRRSGVPFEATTATTRQGFLDELLSGSFDVVISDYRMKTWTGMDALALVKQFSPEVPVILQTGTLGDERAVECIKQGVTDYILKEQLARLPMILLRAREERQLRIAEIKALDALRESEVRYRELVQHLTYGILWAEVPSGRLLDVNPALVQMLGYDSSRELLHVGFTADLFCDPAERETLVAQYMQSGYASSPNGSAKTAKPSL
jgi:two-component system, cell cycle sensor histidine kinase and response regulator CckA